MHSGQNIMEKKLHLVRNTMEKGAEVSAKYITKKCIVGKMQLKKRDSRAKCNGERRRGFGKIQCEKMHFEQK